MRTALIIASLIGSSLTGCTSGSHSCCKTMGVIAGGLLLGLAGSAVDNAVDPRPTNTDTLEGKRKMWDWESRHQMDDS